VVRLKDKARELSTFVEVRFGRTTEARIELGAAPVVALPAAAFPPSSSRSSRKPPGCVRWPSPPSRRRASAVIGVAFHARAHSTASDLNSRALSNQLQPRDVQAFHRRRPEHESGARLYVAAAVLAAAGGGLLWWDLQSDSVGVQRAF